MNNSKNTVKAINKDNKVIYVYHHPDSKEHEGWLKIGDQTGYQSGRIKDQNEADNIRAETLYMTEAIDKNGKEFRDYEVHAIIDVTGKFEREEKKNSKSGKFSEWYRMSKNEAIEAIEARKKLTGFNPAILKQANPDINPREEQQDAINKTYSYWKHAANERRDFLWNAKPRFGKTLTSYWFLEKINAKKVLIVTNRPSISDSWYTDYRRFIQPKGVYKFGSSMLNKNLVKEGNLKGRALNVNETKEEIGNGSPCIFFISLQNIKGRDRKQSENFKEKNKWIFEESWDLLIIDESHEAVDTPNSQYLLKNLKTNFTLHLSGTPFKQLAKKRFSKEQIFNWTYEDEQTAKIEWDPLDGENPYYELPKMNMFAYRLSNVLAKKVDEGGYAFTLNELFQTSKGKFVNEDMVLRFLDNMFGVNTNNNQVQRPFPFADSEIRNELRHTFWLLPSVAAVKALKKLMQEQGITNPARKIFANYHIIDAADKGDDEHIGSTVLEKVKNTIGDNETAMESKTITLSCGQLTTGVTIKPWTAVMMLYGAEDGKTSATKYLQAAFRGQNPWKYQDSEGNTYLKENCYVFDFAPDRLLKIFQDYARSIVGGGGSNKDKIKILLNLMVVLAEDEYGEMKQLNENEVISLPLKLMTQEIVDGKFITSNALFNIGNVFNEGAQAILNEMGTVKKGKVEHDKTKNKIEDSEVKHDEDGNLLINESNLVKKKYAELEGPNEITDNPVTIEDLPPSEKKDKLIVEAEKAKKKQEEAYRDHLRYFARAIPIILMAYGKHDTKLHNFEKYIDSETFKDLVGITKQQFQELRDKYKLFNEDVFNSSIKEFLNRKEELAHYYKTDASMDIFDYIPPQKTNQIFTPKKVVKMMIDKLEEHDPSIFKSKKNTFLDPYMKSGLFITEIVKRLYKNLEKQIPDDNKRLEHILSNQVYGFTPTKILQLVTNETIFGFMRNDEKNKKLRYKIENNFALFAEAEKLVSQTSNALFDKIKKEWGNEMKFTAIVGNPPFDGGNGQQIYTDFYLSARQIGKTVSMIFPIGWQGPKNANNLGKLNKKEIKSDPQIVQIDNIQNAFPNIAGAEWTNIIIWQHGYDNGYDGKQMILTNGKNPKIVKLLWDKDDIKKPHEIKELAKIITSRPDFKSVQSITSPLKPYGLRTDFLKDPSKYNLPQVQNTRIKDTDIELWTGGRSGRIIKYVPNDFPFPKKAKALGKYKVLVPYAWGNWTEGAGLGGAYSDIIIVGPNVATTETWQESGAFDDFETAQKHAKYLMTKFVRALLYFNKHSQHSTTAWGAVPVQDYSESWWENSVDEIDRRVMDKYEIPDELREFISDNIQQKTERNIVNFVVKSK